MSLRWEDRAVDDLEEIARRAPRAAAHVYEAVAWLASQPFPRAFRHLPGSVDEHILTVAPYVVIYRVVGDSVVVRAIADVRRRQEPW